MRWSSYWHMKTNITRSQGPNVTLVNHKKVVTFAFVNTNFELFIFVSSFGWKLYDFVSCAIAIVYIKYVYIAFIKLTYFYIWIQFYFTGVGFFERRGISEPLILTNFENEKVLNDIFLVAGNYSVRNIIENIFFETSNFVIATSKAQYGILCTV
jgi:hypothetical protein